MPLKLGWPPIVAGRLVPGPPAGDSSAACQDRADECDFASDYSHLSLWRGAQYPIKHNYPTLQIVAASIPMSRQQDRCMRTSSDTHGRLHAASRGQVILICGRRSPADGDMRQSYLAGGVLRMIRRILALGGISIAITLAQTPSPKGEPPAEHAVAAKHACARRKRRRQIYTPPKTPWGEPDLQGIWPLNHLIAVPLERRNSMATEPTLPNDRNRRSREEPGGAR